MTTWGIVIAFAHAVNWGATSVLLAVAGVILVIAV